MNTGFAPIDVGRVIDNGFKPLAMAWGTKGERLPSGWTTSPCTRERVAAFIAKHGKANIGLRLDDLVVIDIDVDDHNEAHRLEQLAVRYLGETPLVRTRSNSPRRALFYRAETKMTGASRRGVVEILTSSSRQVVAFGMHPSGATYGWRDETPVDLAIDALPAVSPEMLAEFMNACGIATGPQGNPIEPVKSASATLIRDGRRQAIDSEAFAELGRMKASRRSLDPIQLTQHLWTWLKLRCDLGRPGRDGKRYDWPYLVKVAVRAINNESRCAPCKPARFWTMNRKQNLLALIERDPVLTLTDKQVAAVLLRNVRDARGRVYIGSKGGGAEAGCCDTQFRKSRTTLVKAGYFKLIMKGRIGKATELEPNSALVVMHEEEPAVAPKANAAQPHEAANENREPVAAPTTSYNYRGVGGQKGNTRRNTRRGPPPGQMDLFAESSPPASPPMRLDDPIESGAAIRASRQRLGLTQKEMAAAIGISVSHLSNVENSVFGLGAGPRQRLAELLQGRAA